jgi:hypothetical protein
MPGRVNPAKVAGVHEAGGFAGSGIQLGLEQAKVAGNCSLLVPFAVCADATIPPSLAEVKRLDVAVVTNFENVSTMYYEMGLTL